MSVGKPVSLTGFEDVELHPCQEELIRRILENKGDVCIFVPVRGMGTKAVARKTEEMLKNNGMVNLDEL